MSKIYREDIEYLGYDAEVEYTFDPGEPEVHTETNGDPGTPGISPSINIITVMLNLKDINKNNVNVDLLPIIDELHDLSMDDLEEEIINSEYER